MRSDPSRVSSYVCECWPGRLPHNPTRTEKRGVGQDVRRSRRWELRREGRRLYEQMDRRLILIPLVIIVVALGGCSSSGGPTRASTAKPVLSVRAVPITVTTGADCQAPAVGHPFETFPLTVQDNGRTYRMVRCQALGVLLLHGGNDGCRWTTVESSDEAVLALAPIPLPAPPTGATYEDYRATAPGQITLSSALACPSGTAMRWAASVIFAG
jgi:hypothetical protein